MVGVKKVFFYVYVGHDYGKYALSYYVETLTPLLVLMSGCLCIVYA